MGTMCPNVAKGWLAYEMERNFNNIPDYDDILQKLRNKNRTITEVLFDIGILKTGQSGHEEMKNHLDKHWFSDGPDSYWPHNPAKAETMRQGYIKVTETAQQAALPVEILWVCAGHHFQSVVNQSRFQVTWLLLTPSFPNAVFQTPATVQDSMWVVGIRQEIGYILRETANFGGRPDESDVILLDKTNDIMEVPVFSDIVP